MKDENGIEVGDEWEAAMREQLDEEEADQAAFDENVEPAPIKELSADPVKPSSEDVNLGVILDIPVDLSMEIGRTKISIRNLLQLNQGSVVELDRLAGEPLDVMVNGTLIAHGEVVVVNERFGIRLTDVVSPAERIKKLK
jgi:flagellar motor switch protein FliN/FliY